MRRDYLGSIVTREVHPATPATRCCLGLAPPLGAASVRGEPPAATEIGRCVMTIPGVGPVSTLAYNATVDNSGRFANSKAHGGVGALCCSVT